jgi:trehalose-6-phosphatase
MKNQEEVKMNRQEAWNEIEELHCSLRELNDNDLVECRQSLIDRATLVMEYLGVGVKDES